MKNQAFGSALEALKQGKRVAREGWNGKNMFVFQRPEDTLLADVIVNNVKSLPQSVKDYFRDLYEFHADVHPADAKVRFTAYLCMKAADNTIVNGWLASQTDMLAEDWCILD